MREELIRIFHVFFENAYGEYFAQLSFCVCHVPQLRVEAVRAIPHRPVVFAVNAELH